MVSLVPGSMVDAGGFTLRCGDQGMIVDGIEQARSEAEVFALLKAYMERTQTCGKLSRLRAEMVAAPTAFKELFAQCLALLSELDAASRLDGTMSAAIKEVLRVFGSALQRLKTLQSAARTARSQAAPANASSAGPGHPEGIAAGTSSHSRGSATLDRVAH